MKVTVFIRLGVWGRQELYVSVQFRTCVVTTKWYLISITSV